MGKRSIARLFDLCALPSLLMVTTLASPLRAQSSRQPGAQQPPAQQQPPARSPSFSLRMTAPDGCPGETELVKAILARVPEARRVGEADAEMAFGVEISDGVVRVGPDLMTGCPGVFAGGDIVPAERTVTMAIGHGHDAARGIDAYLRAERFVPEPPGPPATFDALNPWYYDDAPRTVRPTLEAARRQSTFDEVTGGLDATTALFEARRCLSCGSCFACDNCYGVCPDNAVIKLEPGGAYAYAFDLDYCKGCGLCVQECPSGAIELRPEPI